MEVRKRKRGSGTKSTALRQRKGRGGDGGSEYVNQWQSPKEKEEEGMTIMRARLGVEQFL